MLSAEWCSDCYVITSIVTHPQVYPYVSDDNSPPPEEFKLPELGSDFFAVSCFDGGHIVGCFLFIKKTDNRCEIHTCMLPAARGKAVDFGHLVVKMIFNETPFSEIVTFIPMTNQKAKRVAIKCGFVEIGDHSPMAIGGELIETKEYMLSKYLCQ